MCYTLKHAHSLVVKLWVPIPMLTFYIKLTRLKHNSYTAQNLYYIFRWCLTAADKIQYAAI